MILFASAGSWGEVQPLLALAHRFGDPCLVDERWREAANLHHHPVGALCTMLPHDNSIAGFMQSLPMQEIFDQLHMHSEGATAIVSPFYLFPAKIVAEMRGIPWIATTTSPIYFRELGAVSEEIMQSIADKLNSIRESVGLKPSSMPMVVDNIIGLFPEFLNAPDVSLEGIGYPRAPHGHFIDSIHPGLAGKYCVVSQGSIAPHDAEEASREACRMMGLNCIYLGSGGYEFNTCLDHVQLLKEASVAIIHGGVGTLCDAVEARVPLIVRPLYFDNFYNAGQLVKRGAALWPNLVPGIVEAEIESNDAIFAKFQEQLCQIMSSK